MRPDVLSVRALNRATLARQLLLERSTMGVGDAVEHVVGLQAQVPQNPYIGLWSRLDRFDPTVLSQLLVDRHVVRTVVMRGTIHLVSAADCLMLRNLFQPVLDAELRRHQDYGPVLRDVDMAAVAAFGRTVLDEPRTGPEVRAAMAERFPDIDPGALAYVCRNHLCLIQVPPRGLWQQSGTVMTVTAEAWLGQPVDPAPSIDDVIVRYLRAFGPSTVADAGTWTRLTGLREVFERMRPKLRVFTDERGRELFDVEDGLLPDPDTPAPPRFLPDYDNVLLSHGDRSRVMTKPARIGERTVLCDGFVAGSWRVEDGRIDVTLTEPLPTAAVDAIERERSELQGFLQ